MTAPQDGPDTAAPTAPSAPIAATAPVQRVVVVGQDGQLIDGGTTGGEDGGTSPAQMVSSPDKVMRIGTMVKQLLEEVRSAPLDDRSRARMRELHQQSIRELSDGLAPELRDELARLALPLSEEEVPSDAELRIAQAQLVGWLEGVFHGIQAALVAQQVNAQLALQQVRGRPQLPGGQGAPGMPVAQPGGGQYL